MPSKTHNNEQSHNHILLQLHPYRLGQADRLSVKTLTNWVSLFPKPIKNSYRMYCLSPPTHPPQHKGEVLMNKATSSFSLALATTRFVFYLCTYFNNGSGRLGPTLCFSASSAFSDQFYYHLLVHDEKVKFCWVAKTLLDGNLL